MLRGQKRSLCRKKKGKDETIVDGMRKIMPNELLSLETNITEEEAVKEGQIWILMEEKVGICLVIEELLYNEPKLTPPSQDFTDIQKRMSG